MTVVQAAFRDLRPTYLRVRNKALRLILRRVVRVTSGIDLVRIGSAYGGWIVPLAVLSDGALCYSAGLGEDGTFDRELAQTYGFQVVIFDPTPRAIAYAAAEMETVPGVEFRPVGLWSSCAVLKFYVPRDASHVSHSIVNLQETDNYFEADCESLADAMSVRGDSKLDLLKLDIEGAEYEVLGAMLEAGLDVAAVCVEFDQPVPVTKTLRHIRRMTSAGYRVVAIEGWNYTFYRTGGGSRGARPRA